MKKKPSHKPRALVDRQLIPLLNGRLVMCLSARRNIGRRTLRQLFRHRSRSFLIQHYGSFFLRLTPDHARPKRITNTPNWGLIVNFYMSTMTLDEWEKILRYWSRIEVRPILRGPIYPTKKRRPR